jgi:uncharacterized paraquat-inducible protein A
MFSDQEFRSAMNAVLDKNVQPMRRVDLVCLMGKELKVDPNRHYQFEIDAAAFMRQEAATGTILIRKGQYGGVWNGIEKPAQASTTTPINNHVCPSCRNDRVNKSEKSCWKCGNPLH